MLQGYAGESNNLGGAHDAVNAAAARRGGGTHRIGVARASSYNRHRCAVTVRDRTFHLSAAFPLPTSRVLGPADYRTMAWKNGGGRTTEIAAGPAGADLGTFAWRASIAEVERDGPFSAFPDVDRTLVLLAGNGMRLAGPDGVLDLRAPMDVATFAGETAIDCALVDGPTRDFNLMVRRDRARGTLEVVRAAERTFDGAHALLCYAATGSIRCAIDGGAPIVLARDHALLVAGTAAREVAVRAFAPEDCALVCRIEAIDARTTA